MNDSLIGKLKQYNTRCFVGSIEDGNAIEITAVIEGNIIKEAKFRCFGCASLCTTTQEFLIELIGKNLRNVRRHSKCVGFIGCLCPKDLLLNELLEDEEVYHMERQVPFFDGIMRYDVENQILLNDLFTVEEVKKFFHINEISYTLNLRLLKILKRVLENYKLSKDYGG